MAEKEGITAETTFREWYMTPGTGHVTDKARRALKAIGRTPDGEDIYTFRGLTFLAGPGEHGEHEPRGDVESYAVYFRLITRLGGDPGEYERATAAWK